PDVPDAVEEGVTFTENAAHKAHFFARHTGLLTVSDDSGLEVDALEGAPGVYSARFAGEAADYEANNRLLLEKLEGVPAEERTARFHCVIALASPDEVILTTDGTVEGVITTGPRGDYGFGYDPVFVPEGHDATFGELGGEVKDAISHRARALAEFKERFRAYLLSRG
ncbi:MAG: RdgB/HAM1 family non-canonical purine NTP pyrophosphatase, partial [Planctomycetota bacterium]